MALAATAREGVVVEFVTVGVSHEGQLTEGAENEVTPGEVFEQTLVYVSDPPPG